MPNSDSRLLFLSGDQDQKCIFWELKKLENNYKVEKLGQLDGHTETIDFIKFNFDQKLCVTGGLNNALRIWDGFD